MRFVHRMQQLAIIGGGPAGLRAAEIAAAAGVPAALFEAKASVGRKFLVAGRGGLNLTNAELHERFLTRYSAGPWTEMLDKCRSDDLRAWAQGFGIETFAATTGRVYPREMKAAPLLRRWVQRLKSLGVDLAMHHRWTGLRRGSNVWQLDFATPEGPRTVEATAVILALGGASWPETGSDGTWTKTLIDLGVRVEPLQPANCGWEVNWPAEVLAAAEGQPLKNVVVRAGDTTAAGELMITRYGLEGGAIYQLGTALRALPAPELFIDFKPSLSIEQLAEKLAPAQRVTLLEAARRWNLTPAALAILQHQPGQLLFAPPAELAHALKNCRIALTQPRPIAEAISTAGGIAWSELDENLMLRALPGIFAAGEMIDWEAPTGGYLIQGCFASGTWAAQAATRWVKG